jgi:hypothetical protein
MINVKLNYVLLQVINATFFILSYLFVRNYLEIGEDKSVGEFLILLAVILAGFWAFYTNRIFYILAKQSGTEVSDPPHQ